MAVDIPQGLMPRLRRAVMAGAVLLAVYGALSATMDPDGYLGTDTGAKVATLEAMDRGATWDPDVGYWAADLDPSGDLHPLYQSKPRADGGWVAVSTLPVLEAARPLYALGGYRATLLWPMLGAVGTAFAARGVARRIGALDDGWSAFWVVGLASPVVVYALDFWEHTIGLACMVGAVALLLDVADGSRHWQAPVAGGLLGAAAVLRNESLVYASVAVAVACVAALIRTRTVSRPLGAGVGAVAGFAVPWVLNLLLEPSVGASEQATRTSRATGTVQGGGSDLALRAKEGLQTLVGTNRGDLVESVLLGGCIAVLVLLALRRESGGDRRFALASMVGVGLLYVVVASGGLGFIPGLLVAFPLAVAGLVQGALRPEARLVATVAVAALPVVYLFQYTGGAGPQWGGRYTLTSAILLGVVGMVRLSERAPLVARGLLVLSVAVTAFGVTWLSVRSHGVARFFDAVIDESEPVVISRNPFLIREAGAVAVGQRWLSVDGDDDFAAAVDVARAVGEERFSVLEWGSVAPPTHLVPSDVREVRRVRLTFVDVPVGLVTYEFTG